MTKILQGLLPQYVFFYIDAMLIMMPTFELHLEILQKVLNWLQLYDMSVKASKCEFLADRMVYLGFELSTDGLAPEQQKCTKIQEWETPVTHDELSSMMGFFTYYRLSFHATQKR